ncbi:hypothetical protein [Sphingomonas trueperi]
MVAETRVTDTYGLLQERFDGVAMMLPAIQLAAALTAISPASAPATA